MDAVYTEIQQVSGFPVAPVPHPLPVYIRFTRIVNSSTKRRVLHDATPGELFVDSNPQSNPQPVPFVFTSPDVSEDSPFDFWGILNRRKWLVFLGLVTGMALGAIYDAQCETIYKSVAKIKIEPKDPLYLPMSQNSRTMFPMAADMAIRHDQLIGQYNIVQRCLLENNLSALESFADLANDETIPNVMNNLVVTQNKDEQVLYELVYYSSEPDDAQTILNNLIATYETDLGEQYLNESTKVSDLLTSIHREFKDNYSALQKRLDQAHTEDQAIVVSQGNITLHQVKVNELTRILQADQNKIAFLGKDLERAKEALLSGDQEIEEMVWIFKEQNKIKDDGRREEASNRDIFLLENKIRELQANYRRLEQIYGAGNKELKGLSQEIETWQISLNKLVATGDGENRTNIEPSEILQRHIRSLEQQIFDLQASIEINQRALIEHSTEAGRIASVQRKIENINTQMDDVRDFLKIAEKKLIEIDSGDNKAGQEGFRFQKLQNATYGEEVWPILLVILGIGGLLGSLTGFGLGCLVELADKTFHNPDEVMKKLNVPLIGHVPVIAQNKRHLVENSSIDPVVCTYHRPKSQVAEAFRAVRTSLYFNTQGKNHSIIQITSPTPGDGKSTLAANLAVSIAQSGKRVLLVDADMRRPRQHVTFGIESSLGFATVLSGQSEWRDSLTESVEVDGLTLMPCGSRPNNPAELSTSPQIDVLFEEMREEFDFVIIDTPPLLAVTDPSPIAARVDGVVLCLRIKKNVRVSAERATEMLTNLGAHCIGLVVNGVGAQSGYGSQYTYGAYRAGYSYNGYGYGYGYGTGGGKYYDEDKKGRRFEPESNQLQRIESADQTSV